jgi:uncharacterized protein YggE
MAPESVRGGLATGVVLAGLVVAYLLGGAGGGGAPAGAAEDTAAAADRSTMTLIGTGQARSVPDQLTFSLGVGVTRPDLETALDEANHVMERVLDALTPYGVRRGDVETTGLSMNPVYDYHPYSEPTIRGYRVAQHATVLVKELKQGGRAVSAAVAAGGNAVRISALRLRVGDTDAMMERARDAAVAEATAKAEQYAAATGQELGSVLSLREVRESPRRLIVHPYARLASGAMDAAAPLPIRAGHEELRVRVQVVWEIS